MAEQSKRVKWVGNSPRQAVPLPDGSEVYVDNGKSVLVPTSVAKQLVKQDGWETGEGVKAEPAPESPEPDPKAGK